MSVSSKALVVCDDTIKTVNAIIDMMNAKSNELNFGMPVNSIASISERNKTNSICEIIGYNLGCFRVYFTRNKEPKSIFVVTETNNDYVEYVGNNNYVYLSMNHSEDNIEIMGDLVDSLSKQGYTIFYDENDSDESGFEKI
ncbi:hypothetical protein SJ_223 [Proteus phage SJ_PmiM]|nr:hypothetical protein SJ_223 [Proteus phage SJ_PmiM]